MFKSASSLCLCSFKEFTKKFILLLQLCEPLYVLLIDCFSAENILNTLGVSSTVPKKLMKAPLHLKFYVIRVVRIFWVEKKIIVQIQTFICVTIRWNRKCAIFEIITLIPNYNMFYAILNFL